MKPSRSNKHVVIIKKPNFQRKRDGEKSDVMRYSYIHNIILVVNILTAYKCNQSIHYFVFFGKHVVCVFGLR